MGNTQITLSAAQITAIAEQVAAILNPDQPAKTSRPKAGSKPKASPSKPKAQPKADVKFRTAKQIATGKEKQAAIWARIYAENGVKSFAKLPKKAQDAGRVEVKAMWDGINGTRKTKVA